MSNQDNMNPPEYDEEEGPFESEMVEGDDDFAAQGDDDFVEEDWDAADDEYEVQEQVKKLEQKKKKSSSFNTIVIAGAVIVGLGVVVMQMAGGGGAQQAGGQQVAQQPGQPMQRNVSEEDFSTRDVIYGRAEQARLPQKEGAGAQKGAAAEAGGGMLNDPALVKNIEGQTREAEFDDLYFYDENAKDDGAAPSIKLPGGVTQQAPSPNAPQIAENAPPMPSPITLDDAGAAAAPVPAPAQDDVLTPMTFDIGDQAAPAQAADAQVPRAPDAEEPFALPDAQAPAPAEMTATPVTPDAAPQENPFDDMTPPEPAQAAAPAPADAALAALDSRLGQIFDRLDQIEAKMNEGGNSMEVAKLAQTVAALEDRIEKLGEAPAKKASAPKAAASSPRISASSAMKSGAKAPAPRKAAAASGNIASGGWILKGAQPGRAMVAKPGSGETYSIAIGDSLAGLGEVLDVYVENGRWVVRGTKGRIVQ